MARVLNESHSYFTSSSAATAQRKRDERYIAQYYETVKAVTHERGARVMT